MNLCHFLYQRLHPRIIEVACTRTEACVIGTFGPQPLAPHVLALRMDAELDFASASALEQRVAQDLGAHPDVRHLASWPSHQSHRRDGLEVLAQLHALMLAAAAVCM